MAVELTVTGNGHFRGASSNLTGYSATEDSTPITGGDSSGGVGQLTFQVIEDPGAEGTILLLDDTVELVDGSNGRTQGIVTGINSANDSASITATSRLGLLNIEAQAMPFNGTLENALRYYFGLANITTGIVIDATIASRAVVYPGWRGNVWNYLKQICVAEQVEISLVSSNIVVRPLRTRIAQVTNNISESWSASNVDLAQTVEVNYYNNTYRTNALVYPTGGWNPDVQAYQVDAGQTLNINVPINVSMVPGTGSVTQPSCVTFVDRYYSAASVYSVAGKDGLPILPAQWAAGGGKLTVAVADDGVSLDLTITGSNEKGYAPYRIAVASGPSDYYSSLRIIGTGVFIDKQTYTTITGAQPDKAPQVVGVTIDNPFITTAAQARDAALKESGKWAYPQQSISINSVTVNRPGDKGTFNYPTFADLNTQYAGLTFAQMALRPEFAGKTFGEWDAYQASLVQDKFENQAFGNVGGARVKYRYQYYRVRSGTVTQDGVNYTAERDTLFSDLDAVWTGKTFAQWDARWAGKTFNDLGLVTLWQ